MKKSLKLNALANAIRQSLSIVFPLITFPYASRILGATEFGKYTFATSVVSYFILLSTFGISNFAVREGSRVRDDQDKINKLSSELYSIGLFMATLSAFLLVLIMIFSEKIGNYKVFILIQSLSIILTALGADWVNTIFEDFWYVTIRYIIVQIIALVAIFAFVKSSTDTWKYCLILVLGSYGGNLINLIYVKKYVKLKLCISKNIKKYIIPLSVLFLNSLATVIYVNSDITMLGFCVTDEKVGIYSLSSKIYNIIKQFINSILIVAVPRLASMKENDELKYCSFLQNIFNVLLIVLFPIVAGVFMLSDSIILIAGGHSYLAGSVPLKLLSFSLIFALFASVYTNCILVINRKEKNCLVGTVVSALLNVILNIILLPRIGIMGAAITTVLAEAVNMLIQLWFTKRDLNIIPKISRWVWIVAMTGVGIVVGICYILSVIYKPSGIVNACVCVFASFFVCLLLYGMVILLMKNKINYRVLLGNEKNKKTNR